jgi:hypothetical protein
MQPCAATPFEWEYTGSLKTARFHHTSTLLPDGTVLVVGGEQPGDPLASAELYDPVTGTWSDTGSLNTARDSHTATLLPNGMVLVTGGARGYGKAPLSSAELYDLGIALVSAASRLTHGSAGSFDIDMPLSGSSGVEDRQSSTYNAVFTFDVPVTSGEITVIGGTATVGPITFSGNEMTAALTGVTDVQTVVLHTQNINGDGLPHGDVPFGFLTGDVNGNRVVDVPDKNQINAG